MTSPLLERAQQALARDPGVPAGIAALGVILIWSVDDGATDALVWAPGSLFLVLLLVVVALTAPGPVPGGRAGIVAIACFAAFTAWCFLSISWAGVKADAWSGANKTLAYFAVYTLFAIRPWRARAAAVFLGSYSLGVAFIGLWKLLAVDSGGRDPTLSFISGRFIDPISYANGNCALFLGASIPALFLCSRRETPILLRGIFLATVAVLVDLAVLCQSRMSLVAAPIVLLVFCIVAPNRLRLLLSVLLAGAAVAVSAGKLLAVYTAVTGGAAVTPAIDNAQHIVVLSAVLLGFVGVAWGLVDDRIVLPPRIVHVLGVGAVVLVVAAGVGSSTLFVARYGDPVHKVGVWWERFKANDYVSESGTPHLTSGFGGAGRYAIWTVAVRLFEHHPFAGIGVDNFGVDWLRERPNEQDNVYPHSVELRALQQTGLVGSGLAALFLGAASVAGLRGLRGLRKATPAARGVSMSALLLFGYWVVHGSVDWLWELPALSAAAFAALGLVVALSSEESQPPRRRIARFVAPALAVFALVTLVPPWLSARQVEIALQLPPGSPAAFQSLDRARSLDPFTNEPDVLGAVLASQTGDTIRQRSLLERAIARNRYDWFPYLELGLLDARGGDRHGGLVWIRRAIALDPHDQSIQFAAQRVASGHPPSAVEMDRVYAETAATCCRP